MSDSDPLRRRLVAGVSALGLDLAAGAVDDLVAYLDLLERWNAAYNLTAVRDKGEMVTRHLLDSLAVLPHVRGATLADLGTGPGLPGIPIALADRSRAVTLIDSNGKKARFLREAVRRLALDNARVEEMRVEAARGQYACITARAFASLADMLTFAGHLLAPDGEWLALKGRMPQDEIDAVPAAFAVERIVPLSVPGLDADRHLVVIKRARSAAPAASGPSETT